MRSASGIGLDRGAGRTTGNPAAARRAPALDIRDRSAKMPENRTAGGRSADQEDHQRRRPRRSTRCWTACSRRIPAICVRVEGSPRAIVARDGPRPGKVGLVIGGGSGHEPTFLGFVGQGLADAGGGRQRLRLAAARSDPRMRQGGQRRRRRAVHVRQLCRRRDELRHGRRDGGDGRHRGAHRADHRRHRLGAARPARDAARRRRQLLHLQGRGRGLRPDAAARRSASASRGRPTTAPTRWAWRWRPARCRRRGGRTSRSATTRWRSAWASTASRASRAAR